MFCSTKSLLQYCSIKTLGSTNQIALESEQFGLFVLCISIGLSFLSERVQTLFLTGPHGVHEKSRLGTIDDIHQCTVLSII